MQSNVNANIVDNNKTPLINTRLFVRFFGFPIACISVDFPIVSNDCLSV